MPLPLGGRVPRVAFVLAVVAALAPGASHAASARAFVASNGIDGTGCTRQVPCRSLQSALATLSPGGEVIVLDSGGYGSVSISQSVSIIAPKGLYAGITVASGVGVDIAGAGARVTLKGLTIHGLGNGTTGIRFASGAELRVVDCTIAGMTDTGIVANAPGSRIVIADTRLEGNDVGARFAGVSASLDEVRVNDGSWNFPSQQTGVAVGPQSRVTIHGGSISGNGIAGIDVDASGSGTTMLAIDAVLLAHNGRALHAVASGPQSVLTMGIIRSVMQQNWGGAVAVTGAAPATAIVTLTGNTIADNGSNTGDAGVSVQGSGATLLASDNSVARNNDVGLAQTAGATLGTLGNNAIHQLTPWAPTSGTITPFPGY